jgi:hypothetical protein
LDTLERAELVSTVRRPGRSPAVIGLADTCLRRRNNSVNLACRKHRPGSGVFEFSRSAGFGALKRREPALKGAKFRGVQGDGLLWGLLLI